MAQTTAQAYRSWILAQKNDDYTISENNGDIRITSAYAEGEINFVENMGFQIIEMKTINKKDDDIVFFLHFELMEEERAKELFREMMEAFTELKNQQKTKVLICCSSGLTSSYFALQLNETAEYLKKEYEFDYASYSNLYEKGFDFSAVLLAPQIKYHLKEAKSILKDQFVEVIPAKVFAAYDTAAVIEGLELLKAQHAAQIMEEQKAAMKKELQNKARILSVVLNIGKEHDTLEIPIRYYSEGEIKFETVLKKKWSRFEDILQVLKESEIHHMSEYIDRIAFCLPGIIKDGVLSFRTEHHRGEVNIRQQVEEMFDIPLTLNNSTDMAALGFYYSQDQYTSINFHSYKPEGGNGESLIREGKLISGRNNIVGEVSFTRKTLKKEDLHPGEKYKPKEIEKYLALFLTNSIIYSGPDAICIFSPLTPDMDHLHKRIAKYLPEEYIPDLIHIPEEEKIEYAHLGNLMKAREDMENESI